MELELTWLLAPDLPSHKQVNLTQRLTKCQADLMYYHSWPLDACTGVGVSRRLTGGVGGYTSKMKMVYCKVLFKTQDSLLNTEDNRTWAQVNASTWGTSDLMSTRPKLVPLLATRFLDWGSIWPKCKKDIWKFEHTLHFMLCFTEVFSTKDQQGHVSTLIMLVLRME